MSVGGVSWVRVRLGRLRRYPPTALHGSLCLAAGRSRYIRPVSTEASTYASDPSEYPISQGVQKLSELKQVTGEVRPTTRALAMHCLWLPAAVADAVSTTPGTPVCRRSSPLTYPWPATA